MLIFRCIISLKFSEVIPSDNKSVWQRHYLVSWTESAEIFSHHVRILRIDWCHFLKYTIALVAYIIIFFQKQYWTEMLM